jgi:hypothetical protein
MQNTSNELGAAKTSHEMSDESSCSTGTRQIFLPYQQSFKQPKLNVAKRFQEQHSARHGVLHVQGWQGLKGLGGPCPAR